MRVPPDVRAKYVRLREQGFSRAEACRRVGVSTDWGKGFDRALPDSSGIHYVTNIKYANNRISEQNLLNGELCDEARRALDDIAYFGRRYFGVVVQPFQQYATEKIMELAASPNEEYVVINQAPGTGKSTFYALILPAWLTAKNRRIRGLIGSATDTAAKWYVGNLRDALTTPHAISADPNDIAQGYAVNAEAALCVDYGRFRPESNATKWAQDGFYVELPDGVATAQKEPTWSAFGRSSNFLGLRVPFAVWDDVYDPEKNRTFESRDGLKTWWSDVAEKRLEPGGLLVLQMQRLDPDDICRYALDMGGTVLRDGDDTPRKYHHIIFKAHYPEHCHDDHGPHATPYDPKHPDTSGCLLYPARIPYDKVVSEQLNNPNFEMVYQQADVSKTNVLVNKLWISGGTDPETRETYPGCMDTERDICQIPRGLHGRLLSVATADPSPTNFWAVQWWGVRIDPHEGPVERYLLDIYRGKMQAPEFLDWNQDTQTFTGLMNEWQQRSKDLGAPITHWIVEQNAAQRFMLQYEHTRRWMRHHQVGIIGHETHRNKADQKLGVQTIGQHYKYGRVRLPYTREGVGRQLSMKLVDEVTRYPSGKTDDCVMAHWFLEWNLPRLTTMTADDDIEVSRPSWMRETVTA